MIVKVQGSLFSERGEMMLAYNKDHSVEYEAPMDPAVKRLLGGRPKAYFTAEMDGTVIRLGVETEPQQW